LAQLLKMAEDYVISTTEGDRAVIVTVTSIIETDRYNELEKTVCEAIEKCVSEKQVTKK